MSTACTVASSTRQFRCRRTISRIGAAMSAGFRPAVATWYRSGWNRWWFERSTSVTRTGARASARAAVSPPKPPPTIATWGRSEADVTPSLVPQREHGVDPARGRGRADRRQGAQDERDGQGEQEQPGGEREHAARVGVL